MTYPTDLPCPILEGSTAGASQTVEREEFEFKTRQRALPSSKYAFKADFQCKTSTQMKSFRTFFFTSLDNGALPFQANWDVEGDTSLKDFRFSGPYSVKLLSGTQYRLTASFDMLTPIKDL